VIAGATSSAFASISMLSLQVESTAQHTTAAAWWACLPMSIPTHT